MRLVRIFCCAVAVAAMVTPAARADEWNKQTFLTFSGPVQVPGATLPAGTYQFRLADLQSNRHVVQIFDKDGTKLYTTILAIPDQRLQPTDKPVVMFGETPAGQPQAIKAWFYPGDTIGDEFVYPRHQAVEIAKAIHQPVLSRADQSDLKSGEVARVDENGNVNNERPSENAENTQPNANQNKAATTTGTTATGTTGTTATGTTGTTAANTTGTTAANTTGTTEPAHRSRHAARNANAANRPTATTGQADQNANQSNANPSNTRRNGNLPKTASPLALYELVSGLAFAGAYGVRRLRSRR